MRVRGLSVGHRLLGVGLAIALSGLAVSTLTVFGALPSASARAQTGLTDRAGGAFAWVDRGVHVVGGPIASGSRVLVLVSARNRSVWLEAVDASTGKVAWKLPEGFSEITPGVQTVPLVHDGIAIALVPSGGARSSYLELEGVRVATGAVAWRARSRVVLTDAPSSCPPPLGKRGFCVVASTAPGSPSELVALDPANGKVVAAAPGVERAISTGPGLYETYQRPTVLAGVRTPGGTSWTDRVSLLFGAGYDPNYGWDFDRIGTAWVGYVGKVTHGLTIALGGLRTIALSQATGKLLWRVPGFFNCGGEDVLTGSWLCEATGTATSSASGNLTVSRNASLTLEGFDSRNGTIRWRLPVGDIADMLRGEVAIADSHRLLVARPRGGKVVVDLRTGATTAAADGEVFWCGHANDFTINPPAGIISQRVGSTLYAPCDANRRPVVSLPAAPAIAAARAGHMVVWAAPAGLEAIRR